jgi:hypothetical protein
LKIDSEVFPLKLNAGRISFESNYNKNSSKLGGGEKIWRKKTGFLKSEGEMTKESCRDVFLRLLAVLPNLFTICKVIYFLFYSLKS